MSKLQSLYEAAEESHGKESASAAAEASIAAYNACALAGMDQEACEREQAAAFAAALESQ